MGNTQDICILYDVLFTLNFLNADEQMTPIKRHWIMEGTAELNQLKYFRDVLASVWKSGNVLDWERGHVFVSIGNKKM